MKKISIKGFPYHEENPFMRSVVIEMGENTEIFTAGNNSGQMINKNSAVLWENKIVKDRRRFIKVYHRGIKELFSLNRSDMDLIQFIMYRVKNGQDKVAFTYRIAREETGISCDKTITSSLANLINKGIIARAETDGIYYINPNIFFNGDRVAFVKSYMIDKSYNPQEDKLNQSRLNSQEGKLNPQEGSIGEQREVREENESVRPG